MCDVGFRIYKKMQYNAVYASVEVFHITNLNKPRQMNRYQETVLINIYLLASPGSSLHCEVLDTVINLRKNSSCMVLFHKLTLSAEAVLFRWNFPSVGGGGGGHGLRRIPLPSRLHSSPKVLRENVDSFSISN